MPHAGSDSSSSYLRVIRAESTDASRLLSRNLPRSTAADLIAVPKTFVFGTGLCLPSGGAYLLSVFHQVIERRSQPCPIRFEERSRDTGRDIGGLNIRRGS